MAVCVTRRVRPFVSVAAAALIAAGLASCQTTGTTDTTGSIAAPSARSDAEWRNDAQALAEKFRANPRDPDVAIRYAQALRATGRRAQAAAVLETAALHNPNHKPLLGAYGRALADTGSFNQALEVLERAHSPDQPDWRLLSVQGAVLDQLGRHEEAQRYYATALRIVPDEPSVLSNLGLSYMLAKDLTRAEETLRRAAARAGADRRVRQNLALVVGLQGRFQEAENIVKADLPPSEAAANVAYLRQLLAQNSGSPANLKRTLRSRAVDGLDPVDDGT
ncbi:MAG TPA: tetratricopeptide repeat protein [Xanthobacteraceae bacterium]|nr:tetratricopeptide repeat protein [Xanthobacteraceae bacterium]